MQLREVLDLVARVRRRGRILRLVLAVAGRRLVLLVAGLSSCSPPLLAAW